MEDSRFLGACAFYWGQKQEGTHTWFSLFDENGGQSQPVGTLKYIWTGTQPSIKYPDVQFMLLNNLGARDNILISADQSCQAELRMHSFGRIKSVKWQIFEEDWYRENKRSNTKKLTPLENLNENTQNFKVTFQAPTKEGPYRIFATIYNEDGNFATSNTPFYVVNSK